MEARGAWESGRTADGNYGVVSEESRQASAPRSSMKQLDGIGRGAAPMFDRMLHAHTLGIDGMMPPECGLVDTSTREGVDNLCHQP